VFTSLGLRAWVETTVAQFTLNVFGVATTAFLKFPSSTPPRGLGRASLTIAAQLCSVGEREAEEEIRARKGLGSEGGGVPDSRAGSVLVQEAWG